MQVVQFSSFSWHQLQTLKNCEQYTLPLRGDEVDALITEVGDLVGALTGNLVGDEVVEVFVGELVCDWVGALVGQIPHDTLHVSFAGPMPLYQSVFFLQILPILSCGFNANQPHFFKWVNHSSS